MGIAASAKFVYALAAGELDADLDFLSRATLRIGRNYGFNYSVSLDQLILEQMPLIRKYATYYKQRFGGTVESWLGPVTIGVANALVKFDTNRGVKFETYCNYKIRGAARKYGVLDMRVEIIDPEEMPDVPVSMETPDGIDYKAQVEVLLDMLPEDERRAVELRFGLGCRPRTLRELAEEYGHQAVSVSYTHLTLPTN